MLCANIQHLPISKPDILVVMENEDVPLRKTGRSYRSKCPIHSGKTKGSLAVFPDSQSWFCFGCGEGGDSISFIMKLKGLSFKNALVYLKIKPGRTASVDPMKAKRKLLQQDYADILMEIYNHLCDQSRNFHKIRLQVKKRPSVLTDKGIENYAAQMGELAKIDNDIDVLLYGFFEEKTYFIKEKRKCWRKN